MLTKSILFERGICQRIEHALPFKMICHVRLVSS
jgi:hypothetical protein